MYAWENPGVPVDEVVNDVLRAFHHPAIRDEHNALQRDMFETVRKWSTETQHRNQLNSGLLSSDSVKNHKNHILPGGSSGTRGPGGSSGGSCHDGGHGRPAGSLWSQIKTRDLDAMSGGASSYLSTPSGPPHQSHSRPTSSGGYQQHQQPPQPTHSPGYSGAPPQGYAKPAYQQGGYAQQYSQLAYGQQPPQQGHWQSGPPPPQPPQHPQQYGGGGYQQQPQYPPHGGHQQQQGGWGGPRY